MISHLVATRTPRELAAELVKTVRENCQLRDDIDKARYELFWSKALTNEEPKNG